MLPMVRNPQAMPRGGIAGSSRASLFETTIESSTVEEGGGTFYVGGTSLGASTHLLSHDTIADNTAPFGSTVFVTGVSHTLGGVSKVGGASVCRRAS